MAKQKKPNIEFHSILDGIKNIEERNKAFKRLSKEGQRLEIAWDCLKLLERKSIRAIGRGVAYWGGKLHSMKSTTDLFNNISSFIDRLNALKSKESCMVCARGGLMVSTIRLNNGLKHIYNMEQGTPKNIVGFSLDDFHNIEVEYERSEFWHPYASGSDEKLMNIMCNILVNGNFKPSDRTDYLI